MLLKNTASPWTSNEFMADTKNKSRIMILSELMSFPTIRSAHWKGGIDGQGVKPGDLVAISGASPSKWYLSWVVEIDPNDGWPNYLLESIEDGELGWWSNVSINYYDRSKVNDCWRWTDRQFALQERWWRVAFKKNDAYIVLPVWPVFDENGGVTLDVRIRHGLSDFHNKKTYPDWRKVTIAMMDAYYKESVAFYESSKKPAATLT